MRVRHWHERKHTPARVFPCSTLPSRNASRNKTHDVAASPSWCHQCVCKRSAAHYSTLVDAMATRQVPAAAAIAAFVGGAVMLTEFWLHRRRRALSDAGRTSSFNKSDSQDDKRRVTLEEMLQDGVLSVKPIGTVRSIYRLCVGTPRQGLLAPHARGRLELHGPSSRDAVLELDGFSHIWVVFVFHLNTVSKNQRVPSKIAPPALGGKKVGVLATRSPHRKNPIGMTLCKLESITLPSKNSSVTVLNVSGLDLVDGTPILDIKPYVPHYDSVPVEDVRLPPWVSGGLATRRPVHIESNALDELQDILAKDSSALDFYGTNSGDGSLDETMKAATHAIAEVLSIDVRSKWQTNKARDSKFQAERAGRVRDVLLDDDDDNSTNSDANQQCTQQLDNLLVSYTVEAPEQHERSTSEGSGAEDVVHVHSIRLLKSEGDSGETESVEEVDTVSEVPVVSSSTDSKGAEEAPASKGAKKTPAPKISASKTIETEKSPTGAPPTDADYKSLKNYWSEAASKNTPTGLLPEEGLSRQQSQKFFTFSAKAKPVSPERKSSHVTASKSGAMIHPMDGEEEEATSLNVTDSQDSIET